MLTKYIRKCKQVNALAIGVVHHVNINSHTCIFIFHSCICLLCTTGNNIYGTDYHYLCYEIDGLFVNCEVDIKLVFISYCAVDLKSLIVLNNVILSHLIL